MVPALFVAGAIALTIRLWFARPIRSTIGLGLILFGLVFYRYWRDRTPAETAPAAD